MSGEAAAPAGDPGRGGAGPSGEARPDPAARTRREKEEAGEEPCLRCGVPIPARLMGCKGGHCPNCGHPYPHGDCSD